MKNDDFVHILTRVVNSKYGPRFLEAVHELREILEEAGIAEEVAPKLEPGKPLRRRAPDDVLRKLQREGAIPSQEAPAAAPAGDGEVSPRAPAGDEAEPGEIDLSRMEAAIKQAAARAEAVVREVKTRTQQPAEVPERQPEAPAPAVAVPAVAVPAVAVPAVAVPAVAVPAVAVPAVAVPAVAVPAVAEAAPASTAAGDDTAPWETGPASEVALAPSDAPPSEGAPEGAASEFVPAGPNRLIRKHEAPPGSGTEKPKSGRKEAKKDSVRAIVLAALEGGDRTMEQLQEAVKAQKGEIPHLYQQTYFALKKAGARKNAAGLITLAPPAPGEGLATAQAVEEAPPAVVEHVASTRQLNLLEGIEEDRKAEAETAPPL